MQYTITFWNKREAQEKHTAAIATERATLPSHGVKKETIHYYATWLVPMGENDQRHLILKAHGI